MSRSTNPTSVPQAPYQPWVAVGGLGGAVFGGLVTLGVAATGVLVGSVTPFAVMGFGTVGGMLLGALVGRYVAASARPSHGWV